jgi:hypothetical protein
VASLAALRHAGQAVRSRLSEQEPVSRRERALLQARREGLPSRRLASAEPPKRSRSARRSSPNRERWTQRQRVSGTSS